MKWLQSIGRAVPRTAWLSGTALKWIALAFMTLDHIGMLLVPGCAELRILGRGAYPVFAYMIAEGCVYTRHKLQYILSIAGLGLICSAGSYIADGNLHQPILLTFAFSILLIYGLAYAEQQTVRWKALLAAVMTAGGVVLLYGLCHTDRLPGFVIDYGFCGIATPVMIWLGRTKAEKLALLVFGLWCISLELGGIQYYSLAAVLLLALYSGRRGSRGGKYIFYAYYPAHLAVLYGIAQWLP